MRSFTIGQLAKEVGIGVETIRFYERRGLIEDPPRRPSGYRQYPLDSVDRLRFIRRAKELGFSLKEIGELLSLRLDADETCSQVRGRVSEKVTRIERKIHDLDEMRKALIRLGEACEESVEQDGCPFLEALESRVS